MAKEEDKLKTEPSEEADPKNNLEGFEIDLEERFTPVRPNPEFVDRLRRRLADSRGTQLEIPNRMVNLGIAVLILVAWLLVTVGSARLFYNLLSWMGVFPNEKN